MPSRALKSFILPFLFLSLLSCSSSVPPVINTPTAPIPGSASLFDSNIYLALVGAQAVILQAKQNLPQHTNLKDLLNRVIVLYNTAENAYKAYHALAMSGVSPDTSTLAAQMTMLQSDVTALVGAFK